MLRSLRSYIGYQVMATDGAIGAVSDFFFDDETWKVRYLIVDTGNWLRLRSVLISPAAFAKEQRRSSEKTFFVVLYRDQVKNSPDIDTDKPVSRQMEEKYLQYYGYPAYWYPLPVPGLTRPEPLAEADKNADVHLRSVEHVSGYAISANDGRIGHVHDFIVDEQDWAVRYLVVDTGQWIADRKVLIAVNWVKNISWAGNEVLIDASKEQVKGSPAYNPADTINRRQEEVLFDYYGRPHYWRE